MPQPSNVWWLGAVATRREARDLDRVFGALAAGDADALANLYAFAGADIFGLALWRTGSRDDAADVVQSSTARLRRSTCSNG